MFSTIKDSVHSFEQNRLYTLNTYENQPMVQVFPYLYSKYNKET